MIIGFVQHKPIMAMERFITAIDSCLMRIGSFPERSKSCRFWQTN